MAEKGSPACCHSAPSQVLFPRGIGSLKDALVLVAPLSSLLEGEGEQEAERGSFCGVVMVAAPGGRYGDGGGCDERNNDGGDERE